jgi:hypothetical protein
MIYVKAIEATGQIYTDQSGRFPTTSSRGNKYVMILYDYDSNAILAEPLKSKSEGEMIRAYTKLHEYLSGRGLKPRLQKLDNECPAGLKRFMTQNEVDFQLVPPHIHQRNSAKRAISSWKDHFIASLSSTDKQFPMHLWCRVIPQCTLHCLLFYLGQIRLGPLVVDWISRLGLEELFKTQVLYHQGTYRSRVCEQSVIGKTPW